jgi:hypothetical protein
LSKIPKCDLGFCGRQHSGYYCTYELKILKGSILVDSWPPSFVLVFMASTTLWSQESISSTSGLSGSGESSCSDGEVDPDGFEKKTPLFCVCDPIEGSPVGKPCRYCWTVRGQVRVKGCIFYSLDPTRVSDSPLHKTQEDERLHFGYARAATDAYAYQKNDYNMRVVAPSSTTCIIYQHLPNFVTWTNNYATSINIDNSECEFEQLLR